MLGQNKAGEAEQGVPEDRQESLQHQGDLQVRIRSLKSGQGVQLQGNLENQRFDCQRVENSNQPQDP